MSLEVTKYGSPMLKNTICRSPMLKSGKGTEVYVSRKYWKVCEESQKVSNVLEWVTWVGVQSSEKQSLDIELVKVQRSKGT